MSDTNPYLTADAIREATESWLDKNQQLLVAVLSQAVGKSMRDWLRTDGAQLIRDEVVEVVREERPE